MSRRTIPTQEVMICDRCKTGDPKDFDHGDLSGTYTRKLVSALGDAGGATISIDLCSKCANAFDEFMKARQVRR